MKEYSEFITYDFINLNSLKKINNKYASSETFPCH